MAVTSVNNTHLLTAANDTVAGPMKLRSLRWSVTGGTVGQELIIRDKSAGAILARHLVEATTEDVEFLVEHTWLQGIFIDTIPAAGSGKIVALAI
jgi:hypothetical protein